ncbi:MAG TPA: hypothetical protein VMG40_09205 [Bryobacteraceae bacterium]|nr:hypothetical protein [Bryobacteraceae bacterium]
MRTAKAVRIVIVFPGDVGEERAAAKQVIGGLQPTAAEMGFSLEVRDWEDVPAGFCPDGVQTRIDQDLRIAECDILVAIFWRRYGTVDAGGESRTVHEIRQAIGARLNGNELPDIKIYFSARPSVPATSEEAKQHARVLEFKEELHRDSRDLTRDFSDTAEFRERLHGDLFRFLFDRFRPYASSDPHLPSCHTTSFPRVVRTEGYAEQLGDIWVTVSWGSAARARKLLLKLRLTINTNITNRAGGDGFLDVGLFARQSNELLALATRNISLPIITTENMIEFGPVQLDGAEVYDLRISGVRGDAEFLPPLIGVGFGVGGALTVSAVEAGAETPLLTEWVTLGITTWRSGFTFHQDADNGRRFEVRFTQGYPGAFKTTSDESAGSVAAAESGTVFCVTITDLPEGAELLATVRDVPWGLRAPAKPTPAKAIAVRTDWNGRSFGDQPTVEGDEWPGDVAMVKVEGRLAAWELRSPMGWARRHLVFGLTIQGNVSAPQLAAIRFYGGLGPFFGGSYTPNPRFGVNLPVPRFTPALLVDDHDPA